MKVVLFRHAQKGITPFEDPALTEAGYKQAEAISQLVAKNVLPEPTHCWVSPKIRTRQTLQAVCDLSQIQIKSSDLLNLRAQSENSQDFRKRISELIQFLDSTSLTSNNEVHYLCTHYDWIAEAMTLINSDKDLNSFEFSHWAPAQYIVFSLQNSIWKFEKKGQAHASKID
jgi:phosphohistidine phosphatase SixA